MSMIRNTLRGLLAMALVMFSLPVSAAEILFAIVGDSSGAYSSN